MHYRWTDFLDAVQSEAVCLSGTADDPVQLWPTAAFHQQLIRKLFCFCVQPGSDRHIHLFFVFEWLSVLIIVTGAFLTIVNYSVVPESVWCSLTPGVYLHVYTVVERTITQVLYSFNLLTLLSTSNSLYFREKSHPYENMMHFYRINFPTVCGTLEIVSTLTHQF